MELRREFVELAESGRDEFKELCERYGISRNTGYKWLRRWREGGREALADQSRRPKSHPRTTSQEMVGLVVAVRREFGWGGRKTHQYLMNKGHVGVPAPSTVTEILRREGLLDVEKSVGAKPWQRFERGHPNELWQMDFKGHFAVGGGASRQETRCHPLTALDDHSRFNLVLEALDNERLGGVQKCLERAFSTYGLPDAVLCDNGPPWGSSHASVTKLGVWLLELGVDVLHGRPLHPQTQGKEERFHRTLKAEVLSRRQVWKSLAQCEKAFARWREIYNHERPHDALGGQPPSKRYRVSSRRLPVRLTDIREHYLEGDLRRKVRKGGMITFAEQTFGLGRAFEGREVALREVGDRRWQVFFGWKCLGEVNLNGPRHRKHRLRPLEPTATFEGDFTPD